MSRQSVAIDTTEFMSKYHHPKNVAASSVNHSNNGQWATISTAYSKNNGLYRQKQVDDEINRIRACKQPSSSKITITLDGSHLLRVYHHQHRCLDIQLEEARRGKGRVVWFWNAWETATDERVLKGALAALDASWSDPTGADGHATNAAVAAAIRPIAGEKRQLAAVAAESRARARVKHVQGSHSGQSEEKKIEVIDLTD